jgi:hypothetical protein
MPINHNGVRIIISVLVFLGCYMILRPKEYKYKLLRSDDDDISLRSRDDDISPLWPVRVLGVFIVLMGLGISYLALVPPK